MIRISKKALLFLLIAFSVMTICCFTSNATASATITVANVTAESGSIVSVPVNISNNKSFMGFEFVFDYDESILTPLSVTADEMLGNGMLNDSIGISENGTFKVVYSGSDGIYENGTLFMIDFVISDCVVSGNCSIDISCVSTNTFDENYEPIDFECVSSTVEIDFSDDKKIWFYSDSVSVSAGEELALPVYIRNAVGVSEFTISFKFNNNIFAFKEIQSEYSCEIVDNVNGFLKMRWNGPPIDADNPLLLNMVFVVSECVESEEIITIDCSDVVSNGVAVEVYTVNAGISINNPHNNEPVRIFTEDIVFASNKYVDVPVYIGNNHGIMGFEFNFYYDSSVLKPVSVSRGSVTSSGGFDNNINVIPGEIKLVWCNTENVKDNGLLFIIRFKIISTQIPLNLNLDVSYSQINTFDELWQDVILDIDISSVTVKTSYTAQFIADGVVISVQSFTEDTAALDEPAIPQKAGYIAEWSPYEIKTNDLKIYAKYYLPEVISKSKITVKTDDTTRILISCNFEVDKKTWSSSNSSIVKVDKHGNVIAIGKGECEIKVTCYGKDSFGNEIKASTKTKIVVEEKNETTDLKQRFREAFDEFFKVKLYDFLENLKHSIILLLKYAY